MSRPAIVLVIEGTYPWYRGGVSEWTARYIQAFPDFHFHIVQIATDHHLHLDFSKALYKIPKQVRAFTRIQSPNYGSNYEFAARAWLQKSLKKTESAFDKVDIIHVTNTGFAGLFGAKLAKKLVKPLILTEHALYWKEIEMGAVALECGYKVPKAAGLKTGMVNHFKEIAKFTYKVADKVISVSMCNIADQEQLGAQKVCYIPNGVTKNWLAMDKHNAIVDNPVIGWIGRCAEMKNPLRFFDVIDSFRSEEFVNPRFIMMICDANEPVLWRQVIDRAEKYPELTLVTNESAKNYLDAMDALCITSHNESQPLVLFEALAKKVLPVGWKTGDVTPAYGLILPPSSSAVELATGITALWQTPQQWRKEVNKRFAMVEENHTWDRIFKKYRNVFQPYL